MDICFNSQTDIVVKLLMSERQLSEADARNLWLNSETRRVIQDKHKLMHISGARCYDELIMEIEKDPYWLKGQFD